MKKNMMIQKWCSLLILLLMGSLPAIAYDITVVQPTNGNGTITVKVGGSAVTAANGGDEVTIEITPNESYFLSVVTVHVRKYVTDGAQTRTPDSPDYTSPVLVTTVNKGKYTFTMPNRDVEVSADFTVVEAEAQDMGADGSTAGTYYETLAEAIDATTGVADGNTVLMRINVTASLTISRNITLDLSDNTLTAAASSSAITLTAGMVTIKGGTITGGNVTGNGGGINVTGGTLTLDGVNITTNTASGLGGGVYFNGTALYLKGVTKITGNTKGEAANNLYLPSGKTANISEGLADGASIGVTLASTTGTFTSGNASTTFDPTTYFTSDNANYVVLHELDDSNQAQIYSYSGDDGNIHWVYDRANTTLTLSKRGDASSGGMNSYRYDNTVSSRPLAPWNPFHKVMTTLIVESGVTTIGDACCKDFTSLNSVTLPEGITSIGISAFNGCSALTAINLPSSLTTIYNIAFANTGLTSIVIPEKVTLIAQFSFDNIPSLNTFVMLRTTTPLTTISSRKLIFNGTNNVTIYVPNSKVNSYQGAQYWSSYKTRIKGWTYDMTNTNTTVTLEAAEADYTGENIKPTLSSVIINGDANIVSEDGNVNALNLTHTFSNADVPVTAYTVEYAVDATTPAFSTTLPNAVNNYLVHVKGGVANQDYSGTSNTANFYIKRNMANEGIVLDGTRQWDTYYASEDLALPTGVAAYIVTAYSNTSVTASPITYIPKNVGVLLYSASAVDAADLKASAYTGATSTFGSNILRGGVTTMESGGANYILFNNTFVLADGTSLADKRCYIHLSAPAATRSLTIDGGDGTTGINSIENGKLNIENDSDAWYDMSGRRLQGKPTRKGLYIRNGKKTVIK